MASNIILFIKIILKLENDLSLHSGTEQCDSILNIAIVSSRHKFYEENTQLGIANDHACVVCFMSEGNE
jgi:hypothetical protein